MVSNNVKVVKTAEVVASTVKVSTKSSQKHSQKYSQKHSQMRSQKQKRIWSSQQTLVFVSASGQVQSQQTGYVENVRNVGYGASQVSMKLQQRGQAMKTIDHPQGRQPRQGQTPQQRQDCHPSIPDDDEAKHNDTDANQPPCSPINPSDEPTQQGDQMLNVQGVSEERDDEVIDTNGSTQSASGIVSPSNEQTQLSPSIEQTSQSSNLATTMQRLRYIRLVLHQL